MPKTKPNEKCPCDSGLKYKKCCHRADRQQRQAAVLEFEDKLSILESKEIKSSNLQRINTYFLERYSVPSIDMSDTMNVGNFTAIHSRYTGKNMFLLLEKNTFNEGAFEKKGATDCDIMVSYKKYFQAFNYDTEYDDAMKVIHTWFK